MKKLVISLFASTAIFYGCSDDDSSNIETEALGIESGMIAYYPLDTDVKDASGNNRHATLIGVSTFQSGKVAQGIKLDANEDSYISLPAIDFNSMETFTLSLWVNEEGITHSDGSGYLSFGDHHGGQLGIGHYWGNIRFSVGAQIDTDVEKNVFVSHPFSKTDGEKWVLYTLVYDQGKLSAYTNGELIGVEEDEVNVSNTKAAAGAHWSANGAGFFNRFIGMMDDIRIYDRALTANEINDLVTFHGCPNDNPKPEPETPSIETGMIAYYPLDEDVNDASGNNLHATIQGFSAFQQGKVSQGIKLDADQESYVSLPEIDFNSMDAFTISVWVKQEGLTHSDGSGYLSFGDHHGGQLGIGNYWGNIRFSVGAQIDTDAEKNVTVSYPFEQTDANKWILYTMVYEEGKFSAYTDGVLKGTKTDEINVSNSNSALGAHWSANGAGFFNRFIGMMDDVRIYDRALTTEEIDDLLNFTGKQE